MEEKYYNKQEACQILNIKQHKLEYMHRKGHIKNAVLQKKSEIDSRKIIRFPHSEIIRIKNLMQ